MIACILLVAAGTSACGDDTPDDRGAGDTSQSASSASVDPTTTSAPSVSTTKAATGLTPTVVATPSTTSVAAPTPAPATEGCLSDVDATALLQSEGKPDDYRVMAVSGIDCREDWAVGQINDNKDESPGTILFRRTSGEWRFVYAAWSNRAVCDVAFQEAAPEWIRDSLVCWSKPDYVREGGSSGSYGAFRTPSRNIMCNLDGAFATCSVGNNTWDLPAPPSECLNADGNLNLDWGAHVQFMDDQPAELICRGDAPAEGPVLPYGHSVEVGAVSCRSEDSGVTCTNSDTGHGFTVNRASYELF